VSKLVYLASVSQDGYIAAPDGSTDAFDVGPELIDFLVRTYPEALPTHAREQMGIGGALAFGSVLMGRRTYEVGLKLGITSPYRHLEQYVVSRSMERLPSDDLHLISGDPVSAVRKLKARGGKDIWLCGGGVLAGELIGEIDELVLKRQPVLFGAGIPLVAGRFSAVRFRCAGEVNAGAVAVATYRR
jgi:dihydrofolate reductase